MFISMLCSIEITQGFISIETNIEMASMYLYFSVKEQFSIFVIFLNRCF